MKKALLLLIMLSLLVVCGCAQSEPCPQKELTESRWSAALEGGGEVTLCFSGESEELYAELDISNAQKNVEICGYCLADRDSFVIFDKSVLQNFAFDYIPKGDSLDISYNGSVMTLQKQA